MIVRGYLKCLTCNYPHMPRVQVGIEPNQSHVFKCLNCGEPIKLSLEVHQKTLKSKIIPLENCEIIPMTDCTPIYLCADFVADPNQIHNERSFPSFDFMRESFKSFGLEKLSQGRIDEESSKTYTEVWSDLKKIWRLEIAGRSDVSQKLILEFSKKYGTTENEFPNILWQFLQSLFPISQDVRDEIRQIIELNESELKKFLLFYKLEIKTHNRRSQFELFQEYYNSYDQHAQIFPYIKMNKHFTELGKATLIDFDKVKSFYANAYEFFAGGIAVYTCLNNIKNNRPYDQLINITLKKYLGTDKAKRCDNFQDNKVFVDLTKEFDSTIRNASFHNWFFLLKDNETLELRSGGTGAIQKISYTEYLYHCGLIFKQICLLLIVELELEQISKELNVYTFSTN